MGILAAVAVPKFFDLQTKAKEKAAATALSEMKVRVNQYFAAKLLDGNTWDQIEWMATQIGTNLGADFTISNWNNTNKDKETGAITFDLQYLSDPAESKSVDLPRYTN